MEILPGGSGGDFGNAPPGVTSARNFPGVGAPAGAAAVGSGSSTPSDGGGNVRGHHTRRQDSTGSAISGGGGGNGGWSGTAGSTGGAGSESKQGEGEVSEFCVW